MTEAFVRRRVGIPVGAVLFVDAADLQPFRVILEQCFGPIRFRGVDHRNSGNLGPKKQIVVHLPPRVAAVLDDNDDSKDDEQQLRLLLTRFLRSKAATYLPGVRRTLPLPTLPKMATTTPTNKTASFSFVELFAGIGGFRLGLEAIGGVSMLSNELCPHACKLYESYFSPDRLVQGDVLDLDLSTFPPYTMLTAGFPCQPFSNRGHQRGLDDEKSGQMYLELARILTETQPPCFLFENVTQLLLFDGGSRSVRRKGELGTFVAGGVMERVCASFASCGYHVDWAVINSRHFVAQNRERVYIVGIRNDIPVEPLEGWKHRAQPTTSSTTNVRNVLEPDDSPAVKASELTQSQWSKIQSMYKSKNEVASIDACIRLDAKAPTLISQYHRVGSLSTKFICHDLDGSDRDGAAGRRRPRFLTPRECCRLMGFPEDFPVHGVVDDAHLYQGIGNAVTPPVISAIGRELLQCVGAAIRVRDGPAIA